MSDQGKNTTSENAIGWFILGLVGVALFFLFWHYFHEEVKSLYRWIRYGEIWLISHFVGEDYIVKWGTNEIPFHDWFPIIPEIPADQLTNERLGVISMMAMYPLKYFYLFGIGIMGMWALMYGPGTQFRRKMNIDGLIAAQAGTFPVIAPFIKFNPSNQPPRPPGAPVPAELPLFAEALGPEEWVAYNQIPMPDGKIDEQTAYIAFAKQLGPRWQGTMKLKPHKQILLAAFCLKAARKRDESDRMLGRLSVCWDPKKGLDFSKDKKLLKDALKVLRDKNISGNTLAKCNQHAFQTTVLLRGLLTAREEGGVLSPGQFVWLRAYDRLLWYPLNNLGRQAYHMEALGAMAHFKAERMTMRPIPKPKVDNAIKSISDYMNSSRARPVPQLDYSSSKKKGVKKPKSGVKKPAKKK